MLHPKDPYTARELVTNDSLHDVSHFGQVLAVWRRTARSYQTV